MEFSAGTLLGINEILKESSVVMSSVTIKHILAFVAMLSVVRINVNRLSGVILNVVIASYITLSLSCR